HAALPELAAVIRAEDTGTACDGKNLVAVEEERLDAKATGDAILGPCFLGRRILAVAASGKKGERENDGQSCRTAGVPFHRRPPSMAREDEAQPGPCKRPAATCAPFSALGCRRCKGLFPSLLVRRVVEQHRQLDAAVADLREERRRRVSGIQVRGRVVGWKEDQRTQELQDGLPLLVLERGEGVAGLLSLFAVAKDHF